MKVLLLGGTLFLGKHIAEQALNKGLDITLFNRGKTNPEFLKEAEGVTHIVGDRSTADIEKLTDNWDVVIDVSGINPDDVQRSVDQLKNRCTSYVFISSISAYKNLDKGPVLETNALHELDKGDYGSNKATSEVIVNNGFYDNSLIIRPGLIVGPDDPTDRFTYWPWRMNQGGKVLVPNVSHNKNVQFIDVRDLASWIIEAIEQGLKGTFNATGPKETLGFRDFLLTCKKLVSPENTELCWADESVLQENLVQPWIELPFWLPDSLNMNGMMHVNNDKAIEAGLSFRPFRPMKDTIIDTLEWSLHERNGKWDAGLEREKEYRVLEVVESGNNAV
ncbi:NAD-dependent epimerase/dehydratase family protein [Lentibacillus sediminis]|uniref:NAD-dependent epimerase/dehydratase family protein n=1 Tax=Lentibacillus sediminis TaxID=1940529 RepID=UPI000C1C55F6|nr:NAD-dependent epimerase/dehydratase family protein [Lentibacillus sediminis]